MQPVPSSSRCFRHAGWGPGFLCLDCNLWHEDGCAAQGIVLSVIGVPQGICADCARAN